MQDLTEKEANRVLFLLSQSNISAKRIREGKKWHVVVPSDSFNSSIGILQGNGMFNDDERKYQNESFGGLFQSSRERLQRISGIMAENLEASLKFLTGVKKARVHLNLGPVFSNHKSLSRKFSSASVLLRVDRDFDPHNKKKVLELVSGATGIEVHFINVVIVDFTTQSSIELPTKVVLSKAPKIHIYTLLSEYKYVFIISLTSFFILMCVGFFLKNKKTDKKIVKYGVREAFENGECIS